ncbi:MAG: hypothetical protein R3B47_13265 [Bacteroidia bacterium]
MTYWEIFNGDPNAGGTLIGRVQAVRGLARMGQSVMVTPTRTTTYYVRLNYRSASPTISTIVLTKSPNCGGGVVLIVALQGGWDAAAEPAPRSASTTKPFAPNRTLHYARLQLCRWRRRPFRL